MAAMLDLEEHIKEAVADVITKSFGTRQDEYLQYRNYQNKRKYKLEDYYNAVKMQSDDKVRAFKHS